MRQDYQESRLALRFLVTAQLFLLVWAAIQFWIAPALTGFPYSPSILALTHLLTLSWATLTSFGALAQLLPVLLQHPLQRHGLAWLGYWLTTIGSAGLSWSFTLRAPIWLGITAAILGVGIFAVLWSFGSTLAAAWKWDSTVVGIALALATLGVQVLVGCVLVLNRRIAFWPSLGLNGAAGHAMLGLLGWFTVLTIALSYRLLPMFVLSHGYRCVYNRFVIAGLVIVSYGTWLNIWMQGSHIWMPIIAILALVCVILWLIDMYRIVEHRIRRSIEPAMQFFIISGIFLAIMSGLALIMSANLLPITPAKQLQILFMMGLEGWIGIAIIAMAHKIIPFLIWIMRTSQGTPATPAAVRELFSTSLNRLTLWGYSGGAGLIIVGVGIQSTVLIRSGSGLIFLAGCGLLANMLRGWKHHSIPRSPNIATKASS